MFDGNITELVCNVNEIVYVGDRFEFNRVSLTAWGVNAIMEQRNKVGTQENNPSWIVLLLCT
jgi:hypothetical protein